MIVNSGLGVLTYQNTQPPQSRDQTHLLAGPTWYLVSYQSSYSVAGSQEPFTLFNPNGTLTGFTGCNNFQGNYSTSLQNITISNLSSTKAACPNSTLQAQEQAMLGVLGTARDYQVVDTVMQIVGSSGVLNYSLTPLRRSEVVQPPVAAFTGPREAATGQVVTFDGTIDEASWTKWVSVGVPSVDAAHTLLQTVDQPSGETGYVQAAGLGSGVLKLSIPPVPPELTKVNYVRFGPLLVSGLNAANYPLLRSQLVVNGSVLYTRTFEVDSGGDFFLALVELGPLNILGPLWGSDSSINGRQIWFSSVAATFRGDEPIPEFG